MSRPESFALIFDCDGTLTDSMPLHYASWNDTLAAYGVSFPEDLFYALAGVPSAKIVGQLAAEQGVAIDVDAAAKQKEVAFYELLQSIRPIEPVVAIAAQHRGRCPMAVASGGLRNVVRRQLDYIGILDWFDAVVTAEDTERHKPEPDVFLQAAMRLNVAPKNCRVYEDSDLGLQAARSAGMEAIDVRELI